jgi:hypothetical protein
MTTAPVRIQFWLLVLLVGLAACTRPGSLDQLAAIPAATATSYPALPPQRNLEHGGFVFVAPEGYSLEYYPGIVFINDPEEYLFLSLGGGYETVAVIPAEIIRQTVDSLTGDMDELNTAEPVEVSVAGHSGLAVSFQGVEDDRPVEGQVLYVLLENQQSFTMIGIGERDIWIEQGQALFTQVLDELAFFEATPLTNGCPVTRDPDYGYSPDKPIRVASVVQDQIGPLADFYFEFLRAPGDQPVSTSLIGSLPVEDSMLDIYQVTYEGASQPVELYVDEYHAGQLMLPVGFECQY